jgi:hypothetical protein
VEVAEAVEPAVEVGEEVERWPCREQPARLSVATPAVVRAARRVLLTA